MAAQGTAVWLAATKLTAPARRHDALHRHRLIEAVGKSLSDARLTLISAPAGAGKTALLAELPHAFPHTTWAWLQLDAEDDDPSRFVSALEAALEAAGVALGDFPARPADARGQIAAIVNHIGQMSQPVAIVLDDLHTISGRPVHELLEYLVDRVPSNLRVVAATRQDPPMALARLRARGDLGEIRLQDLCFTEEETGVLANGCLGLNLTGPEITLLHSRTEGWAAGLRLLATSISQHPSNRTSLLQSGMQGSRRIFDFLAEEVLDRQEPELRNFLLETSILSSLRPAVCDVLTGRRDSFRILDDLYRRNLYVVSADEAETSFRYHDLFADFLREHLRRERPEDWKALHERAAAAEPVLHDRLRHLLAAGSWEAAAREIAAVGPEYARRGFVVTLQRWINELPDAVRLRYPRVTYLLGHAIWTQSEFSQAQPYLEQALEGFKQNGDVVGRGETLAALANSALMNNRFDECRERVREALSFEIPASSLVNLHSAICWDAIYHENWDEAVNHLDKVYEMVESGPGASNPLAIQLILFSEGLPGYVDRIERLCSSMRPRLSGQPDLAQATYHLLFGATRLYRGDMDSAEREAGHAISIARDCEQIVNISAALGTSFAIAAAATGRWDEMERWATDGLNEEKYGQITRNWRLHFLFLQARARWHSGNIEGLRKTYEDAMRPNPVEAPAASPYRYLIRGILRMGEKSHAQAEQAFRDALREQERYQVTRAISSAHTMLAYALLVRGQAADAVECFRTFLETAERLHLPGMVIRENPIVIPLLRQAYERKIRREYAARMLEMLGAPIDTMEADGREALSERELEVLRVMAEGLGNREIGER